MGKKSPKVDIYRVDTVDRETGEVIEKIHVEYDPTEIRAFYTDLEHGIPKKNKTKKPFHMQSRSIHEPKRLTYDEHAILSILFGYIAWENNTIQLNGKYLNLSDISKELGIHKRKLKKLLDGLEQKGILLYRKTNKDIHVEISKSVVWYGSGKNR